MAKARKKKNGRYRAVSEGGRKEAARVAATSVKLEKARHIREARDPLMDALGVGYFPEKWSDDDCARVIGHLRADWRQVQAYFQQDSDAMAKLVKYRKTFIDGLINDLAADKQRYPGLIANASGSTDLTSDYDVTLAVTGPDDPNEPDLPPAARDADARAAVELNRRIKAKFGKQSATVFDTNFYLCDFLGKFKNTIVKGKPDAKAVARTSPASPEYQDVLALLKVRRYMTKDEWADYATGIVDGAGVGASDAFFRADAIFRANLHTLVERVEPLSEVVRQVVFQGLAADDDEGKLHALDALFPDRVRAAADERCQDANLRLRRLQAELADWTPASARPIDQIRAEIEEFTGKAAFFASEAYHTEGALLHIVLRRDDLPPERWLESLNEQFGDFIKDVRHYTGERDRDDDPDESPEDRDRRAEFADGVMYFRGAKYMSRLLQAITRLQASRPDVRPVLRMLDGASVDPATLRAAIEARLMPLRRNPEHLPIEERAVAAQTAVRDLFPGVESPEYLKWLLTRWVAQVNVAVRALE